MEIIVGFLLMIAPTAFHYFFDRRTVKVLKRSVNHPLSALLTLSIAGLGLFNHTVETWWQTPLLSLSFHYLVFDILFNRTVLNRPVDYFGSNPWDRFHEWVAGKITWWGLLTLRFMIFASAVNFYFRPCIYEGCNPF